MSSIILRIITRCDREGLLYCRPLPNISHTGHSTVPRNRRRSLAVLDSRGLSKRLFMEDSVVSHRLSAAADVLGHESLPSILHWRARWFSTMSHRDHGLLETFVSMPLASRVRSRGESWCPRRYGIAQNTIIEYYAAPCGRVSRLCLLDGVLPHRPLLRGARWGRAR
jgi:hypothetical protein